jgi:tryptophan halogenase
MRIPDSLAEKMELFRRRGRVVKYREGVFLDASWVAVYLGQRVIPQGHDLRADPPSAESLVAGMQKLGAEIVELAGGMEDHAAYLRRYCPMKDAA